MDEGMRDSIRGDMNSFILKKAWYTDRAIPYRRGYMLEGPPGNGESSLVQALAGFFGLQIYLIHLLSKELTEDNLATLFTMMPARCIVLFEDIDTAGIVVRTLNDGKLETTAESDEDDKKTGVRCKISLAGLLNIIDDKLDQALVRPGRIDVTVRFALATDEVAMALFSRLYKDCPGMTEGLAAAFAQKFGGGRNSAAVIQSFTMEYPDKPQQAWELAERWIEENVGVEKETLSTEEKLAYVEVENKEME
ncbi:hypothetical protein LTR96_010918 [Exophiala xenobiotica]|nr:hypothetical protein LTR92_010722 [Exophiala xenobiotica]KAK5203268.1 hypothetical protein LTR41_010992 [Exophiala xenobiotica]KAK5215291.1 hypothetical protein LTR72_011636 [Exophiala xenobiotica]KAK5218852.1 hypothetical protein LTR47_011651 [Exophiala xenobiotica]KAK5243343.1 hypothetical protein LTS06_010870 [Exophiala xenobiotica]